MHRVTVSIMGTVQIAKCFLSFLWSFPTRSQRGDPAQLEAHLLSMVGCLTSVVADANRQGGKLPPQQQRLWHLWHLCISFREWIWIWAFCRRSWCKAAGWGLSICIAYSEPTWRCVDSVGFLAEFFYWWIRCTSFSIIRPGIFAFDAWMTWLADWVDLETNGLFVCRRLTPLELNIHCKIRVESGLFADGRLVFRRIEENSKTFQFPYFTPRTIKYAEMQCVMIARVSTV